MSAATAGEGRGAAATIRETLLAQAEAREGPRRAMIEQLVRSYLDSISRGDVEGRLALFAPDAIFEDPVGAAPMVGHEALRAFWTAGGGLEVRTRLELLAVAGEEAAYVFTAEVLGGADDRVNIRTIETMEVNENGLIARMRAYFDRNTMM